MSVVIIGSGLCGLWLARHLNRNTTTILEKSKGVGGRMATRRVGQNKFDHGAQLYKLTTDMQDIHKLWERENLVDPWFSNEKGQYFRAKSGITSLAKCLSQDLNVRLDAKVESLVCSQSGITLKLLNGEDVLADSVVLTSPLPQALDILKASHVSYPLSLDKIKYAKALVLLMEGVVLKSNPMPAEGYLSEVPSTRILTIADQMIKGNCNTPAWTVTMSPDFSEQWFESSDAEIQAHILAELKKWNPEISYSSASVKKWRYSHPLSVVGSPFLEVQKGLYLAGDAFGGANLSGAVASANAMIKQLE